MMSQQLPSSGSIVAPLRHQRLAQMLFIALAYPLTGYLGLLLAIPPGYATAVWPPSGIALAAVLLWGRGVWPGIWAGSLVLNVWISLNGPFSLNSTNLIFCLAAATGATLQALAGDWLSRSRTERTGTPALDTLITVVRFVLLGGLLSCLIASTNAVTMLYALGMIPSSQIVTTFWTWWIGDAIGVMIFTPLVLICFGLPRPLWASRRFSVGLPLAVSFTTVVALFVWNSARERTRIQAEFETLATTLDQSFRNQLFNSAESLSSLRDITSVSEPLSQQQFSHFAGTFLKRNPSAAALAWVERVPHAQRANFEAVIGPITEKIGDGPRVASGESAEYFPIRYSEPSPANAGAVGLNLTAEPNRRECLMSAAATGELGVSGRIQLVQDATPQPSIQLALPVYKNGVNLGSAESRRTHLRGFVTTVLRINHFMASAMPLNDLSVKVDLRDHTNPADIQMLFHHHRGTGTHDDSQDMHPALFEYANIVRIGGRAWELRVQPSPEFLAAHGSSSAWGILAGGLVLVSLLGAFLLVLTGRTAKVQEMVSEKTQSLEMQMDVLVRAEAAVAASEKRFRSYFDLGQVAIAITSPTKGWLEVNEKLLKDFGYSREELVKLTWADVTHLDDLGADVAFFNRVLSGEINGYDMDKRYIRKNGTILHAAMSVGCTRKEDGSIDYFIAMIQDISERQRVRDALLQAKESAEAASRAKGDFLATMSHEIRTPMNGVIGFTELLLETPLNAEQRDYIKAIKNSGNVLLSLINDILDFSKIEAGKMEMETGDFDIEAVLLEVCNLLRAQSQDKGLALSIDIEPDARKMVQADPLRTRQVLLNLLGNAIKFTKAGGVTLRVSKALVGKGGKSVVRISVQDTGIGIPCDKQAQLFQKFTQADSSTTRQFGGTGLGLAICKRLVELMGGEIGLQSRSGHGSVFWFTIPLVETPSAKRSSSSIRRPSLSIIDPAQLDGLFCKVLLAEDNAINQTLARKMLEKLGCRVDLAVNGLEAYKKLCAKKYDVVFMDCHMPEMDGYTATREIRRWESEHPERPSTPIVALTANAFQGDEDECRAAGMDDFLTKPVTKDAIKKVLDRWVKLVTAVEKP